MVFKGSFVLEIVFYFNFIRFFCFGNEALKYKEDVELRQINSNSNLAEYRICNFRIGAWASVCQELFNRLRDDSHYENFLYLNYNALKINNTSDKCEKVLVEVQIGFPPNIELFSTEQVGLFCYAQEPIISDYKLHPEAYPFYKRIMIYPSDMTGIRVFEKSTNTSKYRFVKKFNNFPWKKLKTVHLKKYNIPVPSTADLSEKYLQDLFNAWKENLLNIGVLPTIKKPTLFKICTMAYGRPKYSNHFELNKRKLIDEGTIKKFVVLYLQGTRALFYSHTCHGFKFLPKGGRQPTDEYKLIQGVHQDDIILVQMTSVSENLPVCVPKELIKNFNKNYIKIMFLNYKTTNIRY